MTAPANAFPISSSQSFQPMFWSGMLVAGTGAAFGLQPVPSNMPWHSIGPRPMVAMTISTSPQIISPAPQVAPITASPIARQAHLASSSPPIVPGSSPLIKPLVLLEETQAKPGYVLRIVLPPAAKVQPNFDNAGRKRQVAIPAEPAIPDDGERVERLVPEAQALAPGITQQESTGATLAPGIQLLSSHIEDAPPAAQASSAGPSILPSNFNLAQLAPARQDHKRDLGAQPRIRLSAVRQATRLASAPLGARSSRDRLVDGVVAHTVAVSINGGNAGRLEIRIQDDHSPQVRVSDVLSLVQSIMSPNAYSALSGSANAKEFVTFDQIRGAGIEVRYEAGTDTIALSAK